MSALFDHEKLDVYQVELRFLAWVTPLLGEIRVSAGSSCEVRDRLDRGSRSMVLNTAEGNGKRQNRSRARFFDDARGSSTECAACLDALVAKSMAPADRIREGKEMLFRIASMLTKLVERFSDKWTVREHAERVEYDDEDEHEDDAPRAHKT